MKISNKIKVQKVYSSTLPKSNSPIHNSTTKAVRVRSVRGGRRKLPIKILLLRAKAKNKERKQLNRSKTRNTMNEEKERFIFIQNTHMSVKGNSL